MTTIPATKLIPSIGIFISAIIVIPVTISISRLASFQGFDLTPIFLILLCKLFLEYM